MPTTCHSRSLAAAFGLLVTVVPCHGQDSTGRLQEQNRNLQLALIEANKAEKSATEQLNQVRERLEALGKNLLDGGDDRLVQAAADLELANERNASLEAATLRFSAAVQDYLRQAVVSDPDSRVRVETAMRELDSITGLRQKPIPDVRSGSLQQAKIVSMDQATGMLVLNLGEAQGAMIGMTFRLLHGQREYGRAILADVRRSVSGAFVEQIDNKGQTPRLGDTAMLLTQN